MRNSEKVALPEPLDAITWAIRLESVAEEAALSVLDGYSLERIARLLFHLQQLAPEPMRQFARVDLDENLFEVVLQSGAVADATQMLIPHAFASAFSFDGELFHASLACPQFGVAVDTEARTRSQATLLALAKALLQIRVVSEPH